MVKETTEVLDLVLGVVDVVQKAKADGKIDVADAGLLLGLIPLIGPALDNIQAVPAELAHLSSEDGAELVTHVMAKLAIDDPKARNVINAALSVALSVHGLVSAIKA